MSDNKCYVCLRISPEKTLKLAHQVWNEDPATARKIGLESSQIIEEVYRRQPVFFCGRTTTRILSGLFYLLGLRHKSQKSQTAIWSALTGKNKTANTPSISYRSWIGAFPELFDDLKLDFIDGIDRQGYYYRRRLLLKNE